ncbi:TPA: Coenzyme F420 hydrogenase/dehydrogenase, beta subunit C-terminal domain, partial [Escherichia coli]|nr:Coenzyme F420 hydrogenase/dehydrogenase, beta subunit C-terminal domain [Escherichia coli]
VIKKNYCIGCGACSYNNSDVTIEWNELGLLIARGDIEALDDDICPFASSRDETFIAKLLYGNIPGLEFNEKIGYYHGLFAGYANEGTYRDNGSSGGLTTWLLVELLKNNMIDGVIHVGKSKSSEQIYSYTISESIKEVQDNTRSQYYPTKFDCALENIDINKKYAIVGIPCYIKAVRLLCDKNDQLKKSIKYFIGIFCGHLKSKAFAELLSWQQGIDPEYLKNINFRVKNSTGTASRYNISVTSFTGVTRMAQTGHLYGTDWGLGLFKPQGCEWCDDIAAELADVVFGDAWLPNYVSDPKGTNIVISRNKEISSLMNKALREQRLHLDNILVDDIVKAQAGNYRHRREGLKVRIQDADLKNIWHPKKREFLLPKKISDERKQIYRVRNAISNLSHVYFLKAKNKKNLMLFFVNMGAQELKYRFYTKTLLKSTLKFMYYIMKYLKAKGAK